MREENEAIVPIMQTLTMQATSDIALPGSKLVLFQDHICKERLCKLQRVLILKHNSKCELVGLIILKSDTTSSKMAASRECGDVSEVTITGVFERLKGLITGFKPENVWNTDEPGCFIRALPDKTLSEN